MADVKQYAVIFWRGDEGEQPWGVTVPDLPGCISAGETLEEADHCVREAIELHIEGMLEDGVPVPEPRTQIGAVAAAMLSLRRFFRRGFPLFRGSA
jgi:predicted RNase H-like HicB family nuclease